jgi:hypothetical protein
MSASTRTSTSREGPYNEDLQGGELGITDFAKGTFENTNLLVNDNTSSIINNSNSKIVFFMDNNFKGNRNVVAGPGQNFSDLGPFGVNDAISSFAVSDPSDE